MYHKYNKLLASVLAVSVLSQNGMIVLANEVQQDPNTYISVQNNTNNSSQFTMNENKVYFYVDKVWLNESGSTLKVNDTGNWVTLGYMDITPGNMSNYTYMADVEHQSDYLQSGTEFETVENAIKSETFNLYNGNKEKILPTDKKISWTGYDSLKRGLRVSYGATDYMTSNYYCWHMDGTYVIGYQGDVKINYINKLTGQTIIDSVTKTDKVGESISVANEDIKTIDGYTYDSRDKDSCLVEQKTTGEINLYYVPTNQISITIQGKTVSKEYNGEKQTNNLTPDVTIGGTNYSTELIDGKLKFTYGNKDYYIEGYTLGSGTNYTENGYSDSYYNIRILNDKNADVTVAFGINEVTPGKLNITKRKITVKAEDQTKQYTGSVVDADSDKYAEVIGENESSQLVRGDSFKASVTGSGTDVNEYGYPINFVKNSVKITHESFDVSSNYDITLIPGTLKLVKKEYELTINTPDVTKTYDGKDHTLPTTVVGKDITQVGNSLKIQIDGKEYTIQGYLPANGKDSDTYTTSVDNAIKIVDEKGKDAPYVFKIHVEHAGTLTINPREITLKSNSGYKTYDGSALTVPGIIQTGEFVSGEEPSIEVIGRVTEVSEGIKKNTIQVGSYNSRNYKIFVEEGELYILPKGVGDNTLKVTKPSDVEYNGEKQEQEPKVVDSITGKVLKKDRDYTLSYDDNTKDVGTITVTITGKGNYKDTLDTTYEIKKAPLTISASSAEKEYDGKPLTSGATTITGLKGNDTISASASGSITNVGSTTNIVDKDSINWSGTDSKNYDIKYISGNLKVTPKSIVSDSKNEIQINVPKDVEYNGNSQQQPPRITDKDGRELVEGKDYDISYSEDTINVGTVTVKITGKGNYKDSNSYTYKIKPIDLEIKVSDLNSKYTGNVITPNSNGYQIFGKLANGDEIFITLGGGKKNPGIYKNELYVKNIVIWRSGVDVTKNYSIKTLSGTLTISNASKKPNTGVENKTGFFTSLFVASGAIIFVLLERKNRR